MKIHEFTQSELDYLESVCNFTETETELLHHRQKGKSLEQCAEAMSRSVDGIKKISRAVKEKIEKEIS